MRFQNPYTRPQKPCYQDVLNEWILVHGPVDIPIPGETVTNYLFLWCIVNAPFMVFYTFINAPFTNMIALWYLSNIYIGIGVFFYSYIFRHEINAYHTRKAAFEHHYKDVVMAKFQEDVRNYNLNSIQALVEHCRVHELLIHDINSSYNHYLTITYGSYIDEI